MHSVLFFLAVTAFSFLNILALYCSVVSLSCCLAAGLPRPFIGGSGKFVEESNISDFSNISGVGG